MHKIFRNKKGFISSYLVDLWAILAFIFLLFFFSFLFKAVGTTEAQIHTETQTFDNNILLLNYLKTPHVLDGKTINIADMLVLYQNEKDKTKQKKYYAEISRITKEIFDPLEYCYTPPGINDKVVAGYAVYILDKEHYNDQSELAKAYKGTKQNKDRKFRSNSFFDGLIKLEDAVFVALPTYSNELLYLGFFRSSRNILTIKSEVEGIPGCN